MLKGRIVGRSVVSILCFFLKRWEVHFGEIDNGEVITVMSSIWEYAITQEILTATKK